MQLLKNVKTRAREMLPKYEDLSSNLKHSCKNPGFAALSVLGRFTGQSSTDKRELCLPSSLRPFLPATKHRYAAIPSATN